MINLYDFDKTIYKGDSSIDLYKYALRNKPTIIKYLPMQLLAIFKYKIKIISKKKMKETFFVFLKDIEDIDNLIEKFWNKNYKKIKKWYLNENHSIDIIN